MRSRQTLIDQFSTFLQFQTDRFGGWIADPKLRRSMQQCLSQTAEAPLSEKFWELYWHRLWRSQPTPIASSHLSAYLQETCYWAAHKTIPRISQSVYSIADCFQIAIAGVPKILKGCDPAESASLKTYANIAFANIIRDYLLQRREVDLCSDWGLLLKLSRKQLTEALQQAGLSAATRDRYLLAWACFVNTDAPPKTAGSRKRSTPDQQTWAAIVQAYNIQRQQLADPGSAQTAATLEHWLLQCAARSRAYLHPTLDSLNLTKSGQDSDWQAELPDPNQESLLADLIAQETAQARQQQQQQMTSVLQAAIAALEPTAQLLLQLYYQEQLTQQQIAQRLEVQQYTVSRKLTKTREVLLLRLTCWSEETLHILPTSYVVKTVSAALEAWLQSHYQTEKSALS